MASYTISELWQKACEYDGIPIDAKFVVFSDDNPWQKQYNKAMTLYIAYKTYSVKIAG